MEVWQTWRRKTARTGWLAIVWLSLVAAGCTNLNEARQNIARNQAPDVGPIREKRTEELAHDFDRNRDNAQFEAAASCWQRGDVEGSKTMLIQLLQRNPNYRRARFVLADIYLFNGDSKLAIDQLRQVVESNSNDPMAHYALAQVLDATGQRSEALEHYSKAMQLDPKNEVYSLSYNTAQAASRSEAVLANTSPPVAAPLKPVQAKRRSGTDADRAPDAAHFDKQAQATSNGKPLQTQSVKLASVDEWVRPIDLGTSSTPNDKPQSESSKNTASVMAVKAAPSSAVPVVAAPVAVRAPEAHAEQRSEEHSANGEPGLATAASYSVVSTNPADRQNLQNPLQRAVERAGQGRYGRRHPMGHGRAGKSPQQPAPCIGS